MFKLDVEIKNFHKNMSKFTENHFSKKNFHFLNKIPAGLGYILHIIGAVTR